MYLTLSTKSGPGINMILKLSCKSCHSLQLRITLITLFKSSSVMAVPDGKQSPLLKRSSATSPPRQPFPREIRLRQRSVFHWGSLYIFSFRFASCLPREIRRPFHWGSMLFNLENRLKVHRFPHRSRFYILFLEGKTYLLTIRIKLFRCNQNNSEPTI